MNHYKKINDVARWMNEWKNTVDTDENYSSHDFLSHVQGHKIYKLKNQCLGETLNLILSFIDFKLCVKARNMKRNTAGQ